MRIEGIRKEEVEGGVRVATDVIWEDCEAPTRTLFIQTSAEFAGDLEPSPDALLLALFPIAQWLAEKRIRIDGSICCRLRDGLAAAAELFGLWHQRCGPLRIEAARGFEPTVPRKEPRAAAFLSGGIDALSLLRSNRLDYPLSHPGYIRDCILLHGVNPYDHDASIPVPERQTGFESYTRQMKMLADHAGVSLIPVYTNIRTFYPPPTWGKVGFGAGILSNAFCLARRIDRVEIGSAGLGMRHQPEGSHPWLDHHYSTDAVTVHHAQAGLSRFEKLRIVADWPEAMAVLRPCFGSPVPEGQINCGKCEKCVRTMVGLVALGKLDTAPTLLFNDVTAEMLEPVWIDGENTLPFYIDCIGALEARGRSDLVESIRRKSDAYRHWKRRQKVLALLRSVRGLGFRFDAASPSKTIS